MSARRHARVPAARAAELTAFTVTPLLRDPWALGALLGILPLLARCIGAPLGEPAAEDFDFLHRHLFGGMGSLLDGGGSQSFWRPLAHQVYYAVFGDALLTHPGLVAAFHAALLSAGALLLYRVFRESLEGPAAMMAATFPLLAESTRTLVGWPTQFVDVGLFFFSALALHECSRRRLPGALLALFAALLCKELGLVTAVMLPFLPGRSETRERVRVAVGAAVVVTVWAALYLHVRTAAQLQLPHGLENATASLIDRVVWALSGSVRAVLSLDLLPSGRDRFALIGAVLLGVAACGTLLANRRSRERLAARRGWLLWGTGWFVLSTLALTPIHPLWQPNRSQIGSVGLGVTCVALLDAAHPALAAGLVASRLVTLAMAPGPASSITDVAPETGAFVDFARLTRLQAFMRGARHELASRPGALSRGSIVVLDGMPTQLTYAFGGDRAIQAWARDSTLHMIPFSAFRRNRSLPVRTVLLFQPYSSRQLVTLTPAALVAQEDAFDLLRAGRVDEAAALFARADRLEPDTSAAVFHGANAGMTAFAYATVRRDDEARLEAQRALRLHPHDRNARLVLAMDAFRKGDSAEARRLAGLILQDDGTDAKALALMSQLSR